MSENQKGLEQDTEQPAPSEALQVELEPLLDEILSKSVEQERKLRSQVIADLRAARLKPDSRNRARWWQARTTSLFPGSWTPSHWTSRSRAHPSQEPLQDPASKTALPLISRVLEQKGLSAAVVSTDQAGRDELRACLDQTGWVSSVEEWPGPGENQTRIEQSVCDLVLLDLLPDLETSLGFAAQLRALRPGALIVVCFQREPDSEMVLKAMRAGVEEVLHKPLDPGALKSILARFVQGGTEVVKGPKKNADKLILVMGSKGGVGTTTVTVNLGRQLAQITKRRVVLLDFARPWGQVDLLLDLQPHFTIRNAAEKLERLDAYLFSQFLTHHESGLEVLAGISTMPEERQIPGQALGGIVNVALHQFDYVLIDGGGIDSSEWSPILNYSPTVLLVAGVYVPDFWSLERHLTALAAHGVDPKQIRVVINRWHGCDEEALRSVAKILRHPIFACVPDDYQHVSQAVNLGVPLSKQHGEHLELSFREMASHLIGIAP